MEEIKLIKARDENYGRKRALCGIEYIVVHYTANKGDTAAANAKYFKNNAVNASAHYFVDKNTIIQSVPDDYIAYSVGGSRYKNTKGGSFYGKCTNTNSISVELCDCYYGVPDETAKRAAGLITHLMSVYDIPIERVIRHYDVTGKLCPKPYAEDDGLWEEFKARLGEIDMKELNALKKRVEELEKEHAVYNYIDANMPKWIKEITEWGLEKGIIKGTGEGLGMTRTKAENLVMIKNALGE